MEKIPASYKMLLFNKEANEPLTGSEQEAWDALLIWEQRLNKKVDIDDPEFITALKLHYSLEVKKNAAWEKFKVAAQLTDTDTHATEIEDQPEREKFRIPWWNRKVAVAAAAILVVSATALYFGKFKKAAETPAYVIQGAGYNELCSFTLPDGSQVELNALSSILYPEKFTNEERYVKLTGEAFFTVKSDSDHPFRVNALQKNVVAKGTEFNVKAYEEEGTVTATLQHGKLWGHNPFESVIIKEGDQAVIKDSNIHINKNVNMDFVLAWRQNRILLEGQSLVSVMQQIKRCYNKNFRIEGNPPSMPGLIGTVSAIKNSLSDVLGTIEAHVPKIKFEFAPDSTIIVTEKR